MPKPVIVLTMGDPAGVGPEILLKGLQDAQVHEVVLPVIIGSYDILENRRNLAPSAPVLKKIEKPGDAPDDPGILSVIDPYPISPNECHPGEVNAATGERAYRYIERAARLVMNGQAGAMVTAPIHKGALNMAGRKFEGHTEILAKLTHANGVALMLVRDNIRVAHVTTHLPHRDVSTQLTIPRIQRVITLTHDALKRLGIAQPRIGVLALNPHAGEMGLFGREEIEIIAPAIQAARSAHIDVAGPLVPDVSYPFLMAGKYDALVAMYHDQGHIAFKALSFQVDAGSGVMTSVRGVNITLGLPIIRTSVDHGTALDEAGKGTAHPGSLIDAVLLAAKMVRA